VLNHEDSDGQILAHPRKRPIRVQDVEAGPEAKASWPEGREEAIEVQNQGRLNLVDHMGG